MDLAAERIVGLLIAALGGLAVGLERQRSGHATGERARFAGVRTFTLLGGLAGLAGWLSAEGNALPAALLMGGAVALVIAAYIAVSRRELDATTEVAALVVLATGLLASLGHWELSAAVVSVTVLLLAEKSRMHELAQRLDDASMRAGARFAVMAVVILPLLPEGPYGPWGGLRPRALWMFVLLFSGLSFLGSIARRMVGAGAGYAATGWIGGLVSSTSVTFLFSRLSKSHRGLGNALAVGVVGASTVLLARVTLALALLNPSLARNAIAYFALPFLLGSVVTLAGYRRLNKVSLEEPPEPKHPLEFRASLAMAALFQAVFYALHWLRALWGDSGILVSGAVLGLTDMDALTVSMARGVADIPPPVAAQALVVGMISNTALKAVVSLALGQGRFRWMAAGGLGLIGCALAAALLLNS